ncbi:hypothetical protein ADUPG1_004644, partial [Aduncisulcus paluster]
MGSCPIHFDKIRQHTLPSSRLFLLLGVWDTQPSCVQTLYNRNIAFLEQVLFPPLE